MSTKGFLRFFLFCLDLELFAKTKKPWFHHTRFLYCYYNSRSKQNQKNPEQACAKFQQKILNFMVVRARQSFQFFRHIAWFLGNNRALYKFRCQTFLTSLVLPNYEKITS